MGLKQATRTLNPTVTPLLPSELDNSSHLTLFLFSYCTEMVRKKKDKEVEMEGRRDTGREEENEARKLL